MPGISRAIGMDGYKEANTREESEFLYYSVKLRNETLIQKPLTFYKRSNT